VPADLPSGWLRKPLAALLEVSIGGVWGSPPGDLDVDVCVVRVTELKAHGVVDHATAVRRSVTRKQLQSRALQVGDLILEKSGGGPTTPVGRVGYISEVAGDFICSNFMQLMRPNSAEIAPRFLHLYLNHVHDCGGTVALQTSTTNIRNIKSTDYFDLSVSVPPLEEQRVIVDVLERQLSLLDAVLESVRRSRVEAVRLRRSLLRDAFSGVLTHPDLPPGETPEGWSCRPLAAVSELVRGVTYKRSQAVDHPADGFVPLVRATNIEVDHLLLNEFVYVPASVVREDQYLQSGDIVLAVSSGSSSVVGKSAMVREIGATTFGAFCGVLRPSTELLADFLRFIVQSPGIREMWSEAARGTNINNLKRDQIISTEIVIPPLEEQHEIVELLERELGLLDLAMKAADRIEIQAKSLRRSLLHSAFNGELTREWRDG